MSDPFESVRARPAGVSMFAQASTAISRSSYREFVGEDFIQAFLNPSSEPGCGKSHSPECLCDVDVSKTQDMTWDKCPPQMLNVETHEDLVRATANIWLNSDLRDRRVQQKLEWLDDPETVEKVKRLVSENRSCSAIEDICHISIDAYTYATLRNALGIHPPPRVDHDLLRKFHAEGLSIKDIRKRFQEVEGLTFHPTTISKVLRRIGLKPNYPQRRTGTPTGYRYSSGLSYNEWRERYGEA